MSLTRPTLPFAGRVVGGQGIVPTIGMINKGPRVLPLLQIHHQPVLHTDTSGREMFRFEGYTLDIARNLLRTADREVALRSKRFELLRYCSGESRSP
jgi:DNA-binding response OmpR family regulator